MKAYPAENVRNIGLFSHGGAGKTSLIEAILFDTKTTNRLGRVEEGTTVCDFDPDEIKRHHSISTAVAPVEWRGTKVNLLDTPGYADFLGEVVTTMRAVDGAVIVIDASAGVGVGTERVWHLAEEHSLPRLIFVNKMDRENADFGTVVSAAREAFGPRVAPIEFPIGHDRNFRGVVDLLTETAHIYGDQGEEVEPQEIPDDLRAEYRLYRQQLIEAIAESDETLIERYLNDEPISTEELVATLRRDVAAGTVIPVLCGAALSNRGIQPLLDAIVDYLPAASEIKVAAELRGEPTEVTADPRGPLVAYVFKTQSDPHVGKVSYFRVLRGAFKAHAHLVNSSEGKAERIGQVFLMRGKEHLAADQITVGDIGAVSKLMSVNTGDTITDEQRPVILADTVFPLPSYSAAISPKSKADLDKMGQALHRLEEEDRSLKVSRDPVTGEMILSGLGEPHVQIAIDRMTRRYGVNVDMGLPRVQYRETITSKTTAEYKHKKQTGGAGQYGHVFLELEPTQGEDFVFSERVVGGSVPRNFYPAVEKGVREGIESGPLAGYPVVNVHATLTDGSYHDVDSNEMAFKIAAREAFKKAVLQAHPVLLEPVMAVEITVPDSFTGDVMGDLNSKRAQVSGMTPGSGGTTISALVPEAEIQRYATDLRSLTQGRGTFTAQFDHYQPVPHQLAARIIAEAEKAHAHA